jgi:hypothetical protein
MPGRLRRRAGSPAPGAPGELADEGPFVSFTDLFIGILFLFLILVAALMLMHQQAVRKVEPVPPPPKIEPPPKPKPELPAFRLGIVFNIYQRGEDSGLGWTYSRTVRVFRAPNGDCINTVWLRSNLSTAWMPPIKDEDIPNEGQRDLFGKFQPCGLSAKGDHWSTSTETGDLKRITPDLYTGAVVLHKTEGDSKLEMQYRVLGVYDDYFR